MLGACNRNGSRMAKILFQSKQEAGTKARRQRLRRLEDAKNSFQELKETGWGKKETERKRGGGMDICRK
jgi:hypothetical protein